MACFIIQYLAFYKTANQGMFGINFQQLVKIFQPPPGNHPLNYKSCMGLQVNVKLWIIPKQFPAKRKYSRVRVEIFQFFFSR